MAKVPERNCTWDDESLEKYSMGTLPAAEVVELEEHLFVCEPCQARLAQAEAFANAMRSAAVQLCHERPEREGWRRLFPKLMPALAAAAVVLLLGLAGLRWIHPSGAAPPFAVRLEALRGAGPGSKAPAGRPLTIEPDLTGLPPAASYNLQLVDRDGREVWKGSTATAKIPAIPAGQYFLRVYSTGGELLREYGLEAEGRQ